MKHFSGIDYSHFLDDVRDMYPFSIEEAILTELVANSLDAKTTLLDFRIDRDQGTFEILDNGSGMDAEGFEAYHNFSMSFKRKGHGIGFAGLGAKLALKITDRIVTETREQERTRVRRKAFWGASEWKFERKRKTVHPVWYDADERLLPHHGTRVKLFLKRHTSLLFDIERVREILRMHYLPILALSHFYETLQLYRPITVLINGEVLTEAANSERLRAEKAKESILHRGSSRKPFALARFELHPESLPESLQGIGISTYGKVIRREYLKQHFSSMDRVTGIIEVPELADCLTTSKCDFRKEGNTGRKYYRFTKIAQQEFRRWLESVQLVKEEDQNADRDAVRLQRLVTRIVSEIPDLQQFYGFRSAHPALVKDSEGAYTGTPPGVDPAPQQEEQGENDEEGLIRAALEQAAREGRSLEPGEAEKAVHRMRSSGFGPRIRTVAGSRTAGNQLDGGRHGPHQFGSRGVQEGGGEESD